MPKQKEPRMSLPSRKAAGPLEYDEVARSYLTSAELLWSSEKELSAGRFIAPSAMCLCLGLELFLKARLIERGYEIDTLKDKFGHDIFSMWMLSDLETMRHHAQEYAIACAAKKDSSVPDPEVYTLDWNIEYLGKLYGAATKYALRYPQGKTQVPYVQPLLWVMYELLDDPRWCLSYRQ